MARHHVESDLDAIASGGTSRPIVRWGDPILARACSEVDTSDPSLTRLVADMVVTMRAAGGVGLAANQVGVPLRVFVFECPDDTDSIRTGVMLNPALQSVPVSQRSLSLSEEGCLSIPGLHHELARQSQVTVTGLDFLDDPQVVHGTGLLARCLQHECDHLDGMLYVDRLPARTRRAMLASFDRS